MPKGFFVLLSAQLEAIGKVLVVVAGVAYSIGVILVSFDLAQYRVTNFSLARSQYILVGAVWLTLTVIALVPPFLAAWFMKYASPTKIRRAFLALISVTFCSWLLIQAVQFLEPDRSLERRFYYPGLILVELLVFGLSVHAFTEVSRQEQTTPNGGGTLASRWMPFATIYGLMALTFWTGFYMDIFRSVESSRGGAKHPKAHVVFRQPEGREMELKDALGSLALDAGGLKTKESVTVVLADTDFVVLVSDEQHMDAELKRIVSTPVWKLPFDRTREPWKPVLVNKALVASILYD